MANGQAVASKKCRIVNMTAGGITFNYTGTVGEEQPGRPPKFAPPKHLNVPSHIMDIRGTVIEGDVYEAVTKLEFFNDLEASGAIVVDRDALSGEEKRVATEPVVPANLKPATTVGARQASVGNVGIGLQSLAKAAS
jgi:hypothetical protein